MNTKEFLDDVCNEVKYKPASNAISHELEGHIEDLKNDNLCEGYTDKEAEEKAVEQMGDAKEIGKRLNKLFDKGLGICIAKDLYLDRPASKISNYMFNFVKDYIVAAKALIELGNYIG